MLVYTAGDTNAPEVASAEASFGRTFIIVRFSEPVSAASLQITNFSLDNGVEIVGLTPRADPNEVLLSTTLQPEGTPLTLTINGVRDASPCANSIADNTTVAVNAAALPPEIVTNVGGLSTGYELVASADLPTVGNFNSVNPYNLYDDRGAPGNFSRIAYYLELQRPGQPMQFIWTSMDAFTGIKSHVGIPTFSSGAVFQQDVSNLDVLSNVAGIDNGTSLPEGNIEFWPNSYTTPNAAAVSNATDNLYDFGDTRSTGGSYGSMQVHNHATNAIQTLFAINDWGADGNVIDLGIGNAGGFHTDWTFADNAGTYSHRRLHILVLPEAPMSLPVVTANVPDATNYQYVATLDIPASGNVTSPTYLNDIRDQVGAFSRVAYYMELTTGTETNWIWTAMDTFTTDPGQIGLPTVASGAIFQQKVSNLDVLSNVTGITNGTGLAGGNIEFWPSNYSIGNAAGIPGASATTFDFGDIRTSGNHGSMQVHNHLAGQTLFAFNRWGAASPANNPFGIGIGNNPNPVNGGGGSTGAVGVDWTFANNGASYSNRTLHIFVLPGYPNIDTNGPSLLSTFSSSSLDQVIVSFDEPLADTAADIGNFSVSGLTVLDATLQGNLSEIVLTTSPQTPSTLYTITVSNVRDRSLAANLIAPASTIDFTSQPPPCHARSGPRSRRL